MVEVEENSPLSSLVINTYQYHCPIGQRQPQNQAMSACEKGRLWSQALRLEGGEASQGWRKRQTNRVPRKESMRLKFKCRLPIENVWKRDTTLLYHYSRLFGCLIGLHTLRMHQICTDASWWMRNEMSDAENYVCIARRHGLKHASLTLHDAFFW